MYQCIPNYHHLAKLLFEILLQLQDTNPPPLNT